MVTENGELQSIEFAQDVCLGYKKNYRTIYCISSKNNKSYLTTDIHNRGGRMFNSKAQKVMGIVIIILLIVTSILSSLYYQQAKESEEQRERYINHLYFAVDRSIYRMDMLLENNEDSLENDIRNLATELSEADAIIRYGNLFLDRDLYRSDFFRYASNYLYGVNMTGTVTAEVPPMGENNQLSEGDLKLLNTIKGYLEKAKEAMYSEQTKQENPNLTIEELNEIIVTHLNYHHQDIYKDAFQ